MINGVMPKVAQGILAARVRPKINIEIEEMVSSEESKIDD
jgi:hypothetical protein